MDIWSVTTTFFLSLVLGSVIGLEREVNEKKQLAHKKEASAIVGVRSFALISLMGAVVGLLYNQFIGLSLLIGSALFIILIVHYYLETIATKDPGITTELGMLFSFIIGILLAINVFPIQIIFALTVILVLLLSQKERIKHVIKDIQKKEINAFVSFALIAIVILPFLPNTSYAIADIPGIRGFLENFGLNVQKIANIDFLNPFKLWLIVALITGVDLIGYILERTLGSKRGWLIASGVGGFVSSTATTQSLAQESKNRKAVNHLVAAALFANVVSFIQISILIGALNPLLLFNLIPVLLCMLVTAAGLTLYFLRAKEGTTKQQDKAIPTEHKSIIDIVGALQFAFLFLTINVISQIALEFFGNSGFLAATGIGALVGLDAVMINTAQLAGSSIDMFLAAIAFILANAVNLFGKTAYSFLQGNKSFAFKFLISVLIIIGGSLVGLFFI